MNGEHGPDFRSVALPFVVFTAIWGSTWLVIRSQLATVPPLWSVSYRFGIAAVGMAVVARMKGESLSIGRRGLLIALFIGFMQFCVNLNTVYLAEQHITSGVVATVFALLLIPSSLLAWAFLGHRPTARFAWSSLIAVAGIILLFIHELNEHAAAPRQVVAGILLTMVGMLGASVATVAQARPEVRRLPLLALLAWSMAAGTLIDAVLALLFSGPPVIDRSASYWLGLLYLSLLGTVLTFSLYYPVVRKIGPGKAAYSSVIVPIIAMALSTWFEDYRWTPTSIAGAVLALGGMAGAMSRKRVRLSAPDAS